MLGILWQVAAATDTSAAKVAAAASPHGVPEQLIVKNPVPGFVGQIFQFLFNTPTWVQWGGIALGGIVGLVVAAWVISHREAVATWFGERSRGHKTAVAMLAAVLLVGATGAGYSVNHYMEHNNDFCMGCHVMGDAWGAFQASEHRKLECHNCHRQSTYANARQLYFWIAERPNEIPEHAKVPSNICAECHVQSRADSGWKRIVATAGHRVHLNSDSSALKNVQCVTCHGQEVHRFKPVDKTCGQSGCHAAKDTKIVLGKMAGQTSQHCTGCHTFTRVVPENISTDSARKYLRASGSPKSCFGCHEMTDKLKGFDVASDKGHKGVCGTCHNPHTQTTPKAAFESCASGGCHSDLKTKSPFHASPAGHASNKCGSCHQAHEWKPIGRECADCHTKILEGSKAVPEVVPSTRRTSSARGVSRHVAPRRVMARRVVWRQVAGAAPSSVQAPPTTAQQAPKDNAKFSHKKHEVLACGGCHDQKGARGAVTVRTPSECAACHHSPSRSVTCEGCHDARGKLAKTIARSVSMRTSVGAAPKKRDLPFLHKTHRDTECKTCHTSGILLGVTKDCQSCHEKHHDAERTCSSCHTVAKTVHQRAAHDGCAGSGCHSDAAVLALPNSRTTCLVCHQEQVNHKPKRECAECHAVALKSAARTPR